MRPLVLFDIDGTLLAGASRLHIGAFAAALSDRYGAADPFEHDLEGRTTCHGRSCAGRIDAEIASWCLESAGLPVITDDGELSPYCELIVSRYLAAADAEGVGASILPGVEAALAACAALGVPCGLVTGNLEPIASRKLAGTGLARFFTRQGVLVGGFGAPPARRRADLFARAAERATLAGDRWDGIVYVGDTPLDAAAALEGGVRFVGVATNHYSTRELSDIGAGPAFASLACPGALRALLGTTRERRPYP